MLVNTLHTQVLGTGPDVVLLHGIGTKGGIWLNIAEKLKAHYRFTLVDLPGHGQSPFLSKHELDEVVQSVLAVTPPKAHWLGWSFGGLVATQAAFIAPEKVRKLMTVGCTPRCLKDAHWPGFSLSSWNWLSGLLVEENEAHSLSFVEFTFSLSSYSATSQTDADIKEQLKRYAELSPIAMNYVLELTRTIDLRPILSQIHCPSMLLFGQHDPVASPALISPLALLAPQIKTHVIEGAGHIPFLTHPEEMTSIMTNFF